MHSVQYSCLWKNKTLNTLILLLQENVLSLNKLNNSHDFSVNWVFFILVDMFLMLLRINSFLRSRFVAVLLLWSKAQLCAIACSLLFCFMVIFL